MTASLIPGGNRILVGDKEIEAYSFAVLQAFEDGFPHVIIEGLGERCGKAIAVGKDVVALRSDIAISKVDPFTRSNPRLGAIKGVQVILKKLPEVQTP